MLMVRSIFYKSYERHENALTHRFLAIYERLSSDARTLLLSACGLNFTHGLGNPISVEPQEELGGRRPDGEIVFRDAVVAFENKVGALHESQSSKDLSQLKYYYTQLQKEYTNFSPRLLVAFDSAIQTRNDVLALIRELEIPECHVDMFTWQDMHQACVDCLDSWSNEFQQNQDYPGEIDRFLVKELMILLEEMGMVTYNGIELNDLQGYMQSRSELTHLENYLKAEVTREFKMVRPYKAGNYGSLHNEYLGFGFKGRANSAWLYILLNTEKNSLDIGIEIDDKDETVKLENPAILNSLLSMLADMKGFRVIVGRKGIDISSSEATGGHGRSGLIPGGSFEGYFGVSSSYYIEELHDRLGLNTADFPRNLMREVLKLKPVASLIGSALASEKKV